LFNQPSLFSVVILGQVSPPKAKRFGFVEKAFRCWTQILSLHQYVKSCRD